MRWPFMTKTRHYAEVAVLARSAAAAVDNEYARATQDGMAKVHAWAVEANYNLLTHPVPRAAAAAAFQEAEKIFRPDPLVTLKEVLEGAQ